MATNKSIHDSVIRKLVEGGYNWADSLFNDWNEFMRDEIESSPEEYVDKEGRPNKETFWRSLASSTEMLRMHHYPEDFMENPSAEEVACYDNMYDEDIISALEKGFMRFINDHYA